MLERFSVPVQRAFEARFVGWEFKHHPQHNIQEPRLTVREEAEVEGMFDIFSKNVHSHRCKGKKAF